MVCGDVEVGVQEMGRLLLVARIAVGDPILQLE
jgi:hypothetical protein